MTTIPATAHSGPAHHLRVALIGFALFIVLAGVLALSLRTTHSAQPKPASVVHHENAGTHSGQIARIDCAPTLVVHAC
jgi:hypothetical protein